MKAGRAHVVTTLSVIVEFISNIENHVYIISIYHDMLGCHIFIRGVSILLIPKLQYSPSRYKFSLERKKDFRVAPLRVALLMTLALAEIVLRQ